MTATHISNRRVAVTSGRSAVRRVTRQPGVLVFTAVFYLMVTVALSSVWRAAAETSGGALVGYTAAAFTWYVATSESVIISLPQRLIYDIAEDVRSGHILGEMVRPTPTIVGRIATQIGTALPRLGICVVIGFAFCSLVAGLPTSWSAIALAAPAAVLAISTNIAGQHAFAASSFWFRDAGSAWFLYQKIVFVGGGMLIPLEVLPDAVNGWLRLLPFAAMAYTPARLASGHVEPELLLLQAGWLAVFVLLAARAFGAGERHLMRVGA
ncbi:MAG: ABC-2 family transporter protein [Actinomycetota bacterium]